jgi:hypothetical protein
MEILFTQYFSNGISANKFSEELPCKFKIYEEKILYNFCTKTWSDSKNRELIRKIMARVTDFMMTWVVSTSSGSVISPIYVSKI